MSLIQNRISNNVKDHLNLIYIIIIIQGIGILLPWNIFLISDKYFIEKLTIIKNNVSYPESPNKLKDFEDPNKTKDLTYVNKFYEYSLFLSQLCLIVSNIINLYIKKYLKTKIYISLLIETTIFGILSAGYYMNVIPRVFYIMTCITIGLLSILIGNLQNGFYSLIFMFPKRYIFALNIGINLSGVFTSLTKIIILLISHNNSDENFNTMILFYIMFVYLVLCSSSYIMMTKTNFYYTYHQNNKDNLKLIELREPVSNKLLCSSVSTRTTRSSIPYWFIIKYTITKLLGIFMILFTSLSIYPGIINNIKMNDPNFFIPEKYFSLCVGHLTYNISSTIGVILGNSYIIKNIKKLNYLIYLRILLVPLFLLSNYQQDNKERYIPVLIDNDYVFWCLTIILGLSNGYLIPNSLVMISKTLPKYSQTIGSLSSNCLSLGIFGGILMNFIWLLIFK